MKKFSFFFSILRSLARVPWNTFFLESSFTHPIHPVTLKGGTFKERQSLKSVLQCYSFYGVL